MVYNVIILYLILILSSILIKVILFLFLSFSKWIKAFFVIKYFWHYSKMKILVLISLKLSLCAHFNKWILYVLQWTKWDPAQYKSSLLFLSTCYYQFHMFLFLLASCQWHGRSSFQQIPHGDKCVVMPCLTVVLFARYRKT